MFSLQELFGKDRKFFDLFEAEAVEACNCVQAVKALLEDPKEPATLFKIRQARQNSKEILEEISDFVLKTFVTILEREDIESLAGAIYRIPKPIEKFAERYLMTKEVFHTPRQYQQMVVIEEAAQTVLQMVQSLRKGINAEQVQKLNTKLQALEAEADSLEVDLLRDLYRNTQNPVEVIAIHDLFDLLEKQSIGVEM